MQETKPQAGLILVDKPKGITSFDVIRRLRKAVKIKKMGHMGTLDPNATGLLPIALGKATRLNAQLMEKDKCYLATVQLGWATDSYDVEGEMVGEKIEPPEVSREQLTEMLIPFTGEITQTPPIYSALKVDGKPMHELARQGKEVIAKPRQVRIDSIEIVEQSADVIKLRVACGAGTYIRSLAHDLGQVIGCGAHLSDLRRESAGHFTLETATTLEQIEVMAESEDFSFVQQMHNMFPELKLVSLNRVQKDRVKNGNFVRLHNPLLQDGEMVRLAGRGEDVAALGIVRKPFGKMQIQIDPKIVLL